MNIYQDIKPTQKPDLDFEVQPTPKPPRAKLQNNPFIIMAIIGGGAILHVAGAPELLTAAILGAAIFTVWRLDQ